MSGVACRFRTHLGTCEHVDRACGRPVDSFTGPTGKVYQFGEDACRYCIKTFPKEETRIHSKPVADWIKHGKGQVDARPLDCVHRGAFVRSNEEPAKRHCGSCAYHECNKDHGDDGIIRPDLHCGKQCPDFVQLIKEPTPPVANNSLTTPGIRVGRIVTETTVSPDGDTITFRQKLATVETVREVFVAGYPSPLGGADTELDHQVRLWRSKGVGVNLVPMGGRPHAATKERMDSLGCNTLEYHPAIFDGKIVVSFCNGTFLKRLPDIVAIARPLRTIWVNCMCWTTPQERNAHKAGWLDLHLFQSEFQKGELLGVLQELRPVATAPYVPYFDSGSLTAEPKPTDYFGAGRISRDDPAKFSDRTWPLLDSVRARVPTKAFILGCGQNVATKIGQPPPSVDYLTWGAGGVEAAEFYRRVHCIMHATGGSKENLPRVMLESWATGTAFIAENDYGFPELIEDGVNGFLCRSPEHMASTATMLANDPEFRDAVAANGLKSLERFSAENSWRTWEYILFGNRTQSPIRP